MAFHTFHSMPPFLKGLGKDWSFSVRETKNLVNSEGGLCWHFDLVFFLGGRF